MDLLFNISSTNFCFGVITACQINAAAAGHYAYQVMQPVLALRTVPRGARVSRGLPMNVVLLPWRASDDRGESLEAELNEFVYFRRARA